MLNCPELYNTKTLLKQMSHPDMTYPEFFELIFKRDHENMEEKWLLLEYLNILIQIPEIHSVTAFICLFVGHVGWLCVELALVVESRGYCPVAECRLPVCSGFSCCGHGSRHIGFGSCGLASSVVAVLGPLNLGSAVAVHGLRCSMTCGIFLDQESSQCPLYCKADS